jgi:tRNA (cmo5U34)-methyltransferase
VSNRTEDDSHAYLSVAPSAVPRRREQLTTLLTVVPFAPSESFRIVELGSGDGRLSAALLESFPRATLVALDGSLSMRAATEARTAAFGNRARVAPLALATLDWWETLHGADVVISALTLHHLNAAKTQFVYKAIADRLSSRGALLIADLIAPAHPAGIALAADAWDASVRSQADAAGATAQFDRFVEEHWNHHRHPGAGDHPAALFHHLVWLRHAGFTAVDCWWLFAGHAVFGGHKSSEWNVSGASFAAAADVVDRVLQQP